MQQDHMAWARYIDKERARLFASMAERNDRGKELEGQGQSKERFQKHLEELADPALY